jgi:hypothetical protein
MLWETNGMEEAGLSVENLPFLPFLPFTSSITALMRARRDSITAIRYEAFYIDAEKGLKYSITAIRYEVF